MAIAFDTIAGGELAEKFKAALAQIGWNIMDPNMDPEAVRGMTINLKFKPSKSGTLQVSCDVKTKLAGYGKTETVFLIGQDSSTGRVEISEYGNNRAAMTAYSAVPVSGRQEERAFDPETGEIFEGQARGPRDLRAGRT